MEESKDQNPDPGERRKSEVRTDQSRERDSRSREAKRENATERRHELAQSSEYPVRKRAQVCRFYLKNGRCDYGRSCKFNHPPLPERDQMIHETVQTSPYPVRLSAQDCKQYLKTGQCGYGSNCHFNHPPNRVAPVGPKRVIRRTCKFFKSGDCRHGSDCLYPHPIDRAPRLQATTESSSMASKRERERDPRERLQDLNVLKGDKRMRIEQEKFERRRIEDEKLFQERIERQRRQSQENMQRQNTERSPRRETEESVEEPRMKWVNAQENLQRQEQADMERETREAGEKAQEQLQRDTEREEARSRMDQMKPTVPSDNLDQLRESLRDLGIERKEGDGF